MKRPICKTFMHRGTTRLAGVSDRLEQVEEQPMFQQRA